MKRTKAFALPIVSLFLLTFASTSAQARDWPQGVYGTPSGVFRVFADQTRCGVQNPEQFNAWKEVDRQFSNPRSLDDNVMLSEVQDNGQCSWPDGLWQIPYQPVYAIQNGTICGTPTQPILDSYLRQYHTIHTISGGDLSANLQDLGICTWNPSDPTS